MVMVMAGTETHTRSGQLTTSTLLWCSLAIVLALVFVPSAGLDPQVAYAAVDVASVTASDNTANTGLAVQRSFSRGISESVSVTSTFGSPSSTPNHYTRTLSESVSVSSTLPGQSSGQFWRSQSISCSNQNREIASRCLISHLSQSSS